MMNFAATLSSYTTRSISREKQDLLDSIHTTAQSDLICLIRSYVLALTRTCCTCEQTAITYVNNFHAYIPCVILTMLLN